MISTLYGALALGHLALLAAVIRARSRTTAAVSVISCLVLLALSYDNGVIAVGAAMGESGLLEGLNAGRFIGHALITPLLILLGVLLAGRMGVSWFAGRGVLATAGALTLLMIGLGSYVDIVALELAPKVYADTLRYVNDAAHGPPLPAIVAIVVLIVVGVVLWRRAGWPWLFVGAVTMFVAAGAGISIPWLQNLSELALLLTVVLTALSGTTRVPVPERDRQTTAPA